METIHVAYAFDDNYTEMSCVSMASMLYNTKNPVHFHVLESRLSNESKEIIVSLKKWFPHGSWTFHNVKKFDENLFAVTLYYTVETYYRLLLPELLPHIGKIIYIDGDTVVDGDIAELWHIELNDKLAGVVPEVFQSKWFNHKKLLGIDENDMYFNAGVLLLNLSLLREFSLFDRALDAIPRLLKAYRKKNVFWHVDQEVLNHLFYRKNLLIPLKHNFQSCNSLPFDCDGIDLEQWRDAFVKPVVIHYVASDKPARITKRYMSSPLWERYFVYKAMTPYADTSDRKRIEKYHKLEGQLDSGLKTPDAYFEYKKHSLFTELAEKLPDLLESRKLALWGVNIYIRHLVAELATKGIYPGVIIDGLKQNRIRKVFHYEVQPPEILRGASEEYFVLLCMMNEKPAEQVGCILADYGYIREDFHHVFAPLWESINEEL